MTWIYCKDKLPDKTEEYLVIKRTFNMEEYYNVTTACYSIDLYNFDEYDFHKYKNKKPKSGWFDYDSERGYFEINNVVAWMDKPEIPENISELIKV